MLNDTNVSNPDEIANMFNDYCITLVAFMFNSVDENTINFKNKSSHGVDNITNILIKKAKHVKVKPLTLLINQTLTASEFPNELKIAQYHIVQ